MQIVLPTLHPGQVKAFQLKGRFKAIRCGRRFGKTELGITVACNSAANGQSFGIFAPDYKILSETFNGCAQILDPIIKASSKVEGVIRLINGGRIDFWTLNNPRAGRSRKYHGVLLDEVAFAGDDMMTIWEQAIKPSLLDYAGYALAMSTPNGANEDNFFYRICTDPQYGFVEYHAPTHTNPYLPAAEVAKLQIENPPLVYQQEFLAEFVDWRGAAFFSEEKLLIDNAPVPLPVRPDTIFAIIDTAVKDGVEHDGTAVLYCSKDRANGGSLVILDWDVIQIEGRLLETWLPGVFIRLEDLSKATNSRYGSAGCWIEDKVTGTVLLQHAKARGLQAQAIDSKLTSLGKEPRTISASPYVHRGDVKISRFAYDKTLSYRGQTKNHFLSQVCGFRMGVKTPHTMDLLDCFTYAVMLGLGNNKGY